MKTNDLVSKEIEALFRYTKKDFFQLHGLLEKQFGTIQTRAQSYLSIAGIMITLTGFSGRYISSIHLISKIFIIIGLCLTLGSAIYIYMKILHIDRWISSQLLEINEESLLTVLNRRNEKTQALKLTGILLLTALLCYAFALSIMLIYPNMPG